MSELRLKGRLPSGGDAREQHRTWPERSLALERLVLSRSLKRQLGQPKGP